MCVCVCVCVCVVSLLLRGVIWMFRFTCCLVLWLSVFLCSSSLSSFALNLWPCTRCPFRSGSELRWSFCLLVLTSVFPCPFSFLSPPPHAKKHRNYVANKRKKIVVINLLRKQFKNFFPLVRGKPFHSGEGVKWWWQPFCSMWKMRRKLVKVSLPRRTVLSGEGCFLIILLVVLVRSKLIGVAIKGKLNKMGEKIHCTGVGGDLFDKWSWWCFTFHLKVEK